MTPNEAVELLQFTPDGSRLIVQRCHGERCTFRVITLVDGAVTVLQPPGAGDLIGVTDELLLAHPSTWGITKDFILFSLEGQVADVDLTGVAAGLADTAAGALVVLQEEQGAGWTIVDPDRGIRRALEAGQDSNLQLVPTPERQGLFMPQGWIVFSREGRLAIDGPADPAPLIVEVSSGRTVQLRNLR